MKTDYDHVSFESRTVSNWLAASLIGILLLVVGCGGDAQPTTDTTKQYPTVVSDDIEKQLKYDSRVDSFETEDEDLVVNVNDSFMSSPQGMQERAIGQWYQLWKADHRGKVTVKHNGAAVASWSSGGYMPAKAESDAESEDSES